MSEQGRSDVARTRAAVRRSWWPGWIWAIPIAALLVMGWWGFRTFMRGGEDITISFGDVHGLKEKNTSVLYRGMKVGKVTGLSLAKGGGSVTVSVHIDGGAAKLLTSGTRFWLRGATPSLSNPASLAAVLSGPTIMMEPGPGPKATHFAGLPRRPIVSGSKSKPSLYAVALSGDVGGLKEGAPVKLRGYTVGEVESVGFRYDAASGRIETPVTLGLYPSLLHIEGASGSDGGAALQAAVARLIGQGLRARLERDPPVIGESEVTLELMPGAPAATPAAAANGLPQIPAAPGGGLDSLVRRIDRLPLDQIAGNVLDMTAHLNGIVSSPALADAVRQLDATLRQVHETAESAGPQIARLVESLRHTAAQLEQAAKAASRTLGGTPSQNGAEQMMREATEAARSVRELADYLDRHPEALVKGRTGD